MRYRLAALAIALVLLSCGKKSTPTPGPVPIEVVLGKPALLTPELNQPCTSGTIISSEFSSVQFTWAAAANAESYDIVIKNLISGLTVTQVSSTAQLTATIDRNTPYSWYVVAKSSKTTKTVQSDVWKFYNSGPGATSYAPYPAELTSPTYGQLLTGTTVNLTWKGNSVENNIKFYNVYFGTTATPPLVKSGVADMFLNGITIAAGNTYYWRIVTVDNNGNFSDSGLFQFTVN